MAQAQYPLYRPMATGHRQTSPLQRNQAQMSHLFSMPDPSSPFSQESCSLLSHFHQVRGDPRTQALLSPLLTGIQDSLCCCGDDPWGQNAQVQS